MVDFERDRKMINTNCVTIKSFTFCKYLSMMFMVLFIYVSIWTLYKNLEDGRELAENLNNKNAVVR